MYNPQDSYYQQLVSKMTDVALVSPQKVGPFTPIYKRFTPYLKYHPWKAISFSAAITSVILYFLLGSLLVKLASILQFGF